MGGGECSVTSRKGRRFLIYELQLRCKWEGELRAKDGSVLESASGELKLPDVSAESLEELEVEFTTTARGSTLSEAMRREGVVIVRRAIQRCLAVLQLHVAEPDAKKRQAGTAALVERQMGTSPVGGPQSGGRTTAAPQTIASAGKVADGCPPIPSSALHDEARLPVVMKLMLAKVRSTSKGHVCCIRLAGCSLCDAHLPPLLALLHSSAVALEELDLSFNDISAAGVERLLGVLGSGVQDDLAKVYLGGNRLTGERPPIEVLADLRASRPDLTFDFEPILREAQPCCTVGLVYTNSPAARAGLLKGDVVLQFGMLQKGRTLAQRFGFQPDFGAIGGEGGGSDALSDAFLAGCKFESVTASVAPTVRALIGMPIDVIVRRAADPSAAGGVGQTGGTNAGMMCLRLRLVPERWSGQGLLGCILK